jgi:hypothetical protein
VSDVEPERTPDERQSKVQRAISIVKSRNLDRYGVDVCDETYIRRLPDFQLDAIIEADTPNRFVF